MAETFAKFTEHNDWEGESWHFWVPVDGNEDALAKLQNAFNDTTYEQYEIDLTPVPELDVDVLVAHVDKDGYMPDHTKLAGQLVLTGDDIATIRNGAADDLFYKGRLRDRMM